MGAAAGAIWGQTRRCSPQQCAGTRLLVQKQLMHGIASLVAFALSQLRRGPASAPFHPATTCVLSSPRSQKPLPFLQECCHVEYALNPSSQQGSCRATGAAWGLYGEVGPLASNQCTCFQVHRLLPLATVLHQPPAGTSTLRGQARLACHFSPSDSCRPCSRHARPASAGAKFVRGDVRFVATAGDPSKKIYLSLAAAGAALRPVLQHVGAVAFRPCQLAGLETLAAEDRASFYQVQAQCCTRGRRGLLLRCLIANAFKCLGAAVVCWGPGSADAFRRAAQFRCQLGGRRKRAHSHVCLSRDWAGPAWEPDFLQAGLASPNQRTCFWVDTPADLARPTCPACPVQAFEVTQEEAERFDSEHAPPSPPSLDKPTPKGKGKGRAQAAKQADAEQDVQEEQAEEGGEPEAEEKQGQGGGEVEGGVQRPAKRAKRGQRESASKPAGGESQAGGAATSIEEQVGFSGGARVLL